MESKKVLILGAGRGNVPLIVAAKELGVQTVVVGLEGNYPGIPFADKFVVADILDKETVLEIAEDERVDGVLSCASDTPLHTQAYICDTLRFYGLSSEAADLASNKLLMKERFVRHGVNTAKHIRYEKGDRLGDKLAGLRFPLMIKAVDLQGSRGIYRVNDIEEAQRALGIVWTYSRSNVCVIEEYIEGLEFGAQAYVRDHKVLFVLPHGDVMYNTGVSTMPIGHYMPFGEISAQEHAKVVEEMTKAIGALGLNNCAVNADFILRDGEVFVLELTGRSGANCLAELTSLYFGFNYYRYQLQNALGLPVDNPETFASQGVYCRSAMLHSETSRVVTKIAMPKFGPDVEVDLFVKEGDMIRAVKSSNDVYGQVIVASNSAEGARTKIEKIKQEINIESEELPSEH